VPLDDIPDYAMLPEGGSYLTQLNDDEEKRFQAWVVQNKVPFDPSSAADYDMRGFWQAREAGDPRAFSSINPNDQQLHYPDYWKTPYHESFSSESKFALPGAPTWNNQDQLITPDGKVVFDEREKNVVQAFDKVLEAAHGHITPEEFGRLAEEHLPGTGQLFESQLRHLEMSKAYKEGKQQAEENVPLLRKYLPKTMADFLEEAIKYAPMGIRAGGPRPMSLTTPRLIEPPSKVDPRIEEARQWHKDGLITDQELANKERIYSRPSLPEGVTINEVSANKRQANYDIMHNGEQVGRAYARIMNDRVQIGNIDINPEFQRQGIATELTRRLEEKYKVPAVPDMTLSNAEYMRWQKIDPEALRYHRNMSEPGEEPYWHSDRPDVTHTKRYNERLTELARGVVAMDKLEGANIRRERAEAAGEPPLNVPRRGEQSGIAPADLRSVDDRRMSMPASGTLKVIRSFSRDPDGTIKTSNRNKTDEQLFNDALREQDNKSIDKLARRTKFDVIDTNMMNRLEARSQKLFGKSFKEMSPDEQLYIRSTLGPEE
jgi:hypothetical protein